MISRAKIVKGRWSRRVTWEKDGVWRTDMFKSVLADPRLQEAEFICQDGPRIIICAENLRKVLPKGRDHYNGQIWGPFDIDPAVSTVDGCKVEMKIE